MDNKSMSPDQLRSMTRAIRKYEFYLSKLTGRMHQKHFPHSDPLKIAAEKAREAMVVPSLRREM